MVNNIYLKGDFRIRLSKGIAGLVASKGYKRFEKNHFLI